jgi:hypothetical protein
MALSRSVCAFVNCVLRDISCSLQFASLGMQATLSAIADGHHCQKAVTVHGNKGRSFGAGSAACACA